MIFENFRSGENFLSFFVTFRTSFNKNNKKKYFALRLGLRNVIGFAHRWSGRCRFISRLGLVRFGSIVMSVFLITTRRCGRQLVAARSRQLSLVAAILWLITRLLFGRWRFHWHELSTLVERHHVLTVILRLVVQPFRVSLYFVISSFILITLF